MGRHQRAIDTALDLVRMPALAYAMATAPLPPDMLELIRVAAGSSEACAAAARVTGEPRSVLIDAARFYIQQILFRPEADSYRILGLRPGASVKMAREHMRWLLEWLHPDRNEAWDAVYAERVIKAWREISTNAKSGGLESAISARKEAEIGINRLSEKKTAEYSTQVRLPWIERSNADSRASSQTSAHHRWSNVVKIVVTFVIIVLFLKYAAPAIVEGLMTVTDASEHL